MSGSNRTYLKDPKQQSQPGGRVHKTELQKQKQFPGENHSWVAQPIMFFFLETWRTGKHGNTEMLRLKKVNISKAETV